MVFFFGIFVVMNIKAISIAFPFMTFLCIPSRLFLLPKFFSNWEMTLLDGDEDQIALWVQRKQESIRGIKVGDVTRNVSEGDEMDIDEDVSDDMDA